MAFGRHPRAISGPSISKGLWDAGAGVAFQIPDQLLSLKFCRSRTRSEKRFTKDTSRRSKGYEVQAHAARRRRDERAWRRRAPMRLQGYPVAKERSCFFGERKERRRCARHLSPLLPRQPARGKELQSRETVPSLTRDEAAPARRLGRKNRTLAASCGKLGVDLDQVRPERPNRAAVRLSRRAGSMVPPLELWQPGGQCFAL